MLTVQNDWIEYETEAMPARRVAVKGGAACAQRLPVASVRASQPVRPVVRAVQPSARPVPTAARPLPSRSTSAAPQRSRLRLTRRGRIVLIVLPALLVLSGALLAAGPGVAEAAAPTSQRTVVVGTGDTLWTIAQRIAPNTDPRETVAALQQANALDDATVAAGAVLVLPLGR